MDLALVEREGHQQPAENSPEPVAGADPRGRVLAYVEQPVIFKKMFQVFLLY